jgi:methyltransferase
MILFTSFFIFIVFQRLIELLIANRNEKWMKAQGAIEFGKAHYRLMVVMHTLFFLVYLLEVVFLEKTLSIAWPFLLFLFLLAQAGRVWALTALGRYWNTKILVLPDAAVVKKGPYRYIKHPNYAIVMIELIVIPLMFNAYITASLFTLLNIGILSIRIPAEELALSTLTEYKVVFRLSNRFLP